VKLYELRAEYETLREKALACADPEMRQAFEDTLTGLTGDIVDKIHACCVVIRNIELEADALATEEERIRNRRRALDASADRLRVYMGIEMALMEMPSIRTALFSVSLQRNKSKLVVDDESKVPEMFFRYLPKLENEAVRAAIERGEKVGGVHLEPSQSVRIR
jgi:hypothetical protein